jgi:hypoxanthine phosphoribosyltransferase
VKEWFTKMMEKKLVPLISQTELTQTVKQLAEQLDRDYADRPPVIVCVLKGSFVFTADLVRQMQIPIQSIEFMRLSSYGTSTVSSGEARVLMGLSANVIANRHVILAEDIVDTGISTNQAIEILKAYQPASLKTCVLLDKPERRKAAVAIDYLGITIPDRFIVGYGLDANEQYRQLPAIYALEEE